MLCVVSGGFCRRRVAVRSLLALLLHILTAWIRMLGVLPGLYYGTMKICTIEIMVRILHIIAKSEQKAINYKGIRIARDILVLEGRGRGEFTMGKIRETKRVIVSIIAKLLLDSRLLFRMREIRRPILVMVKMAWVI